MATGDDLRMSDIHRMLLEQSQVMFYVSKDKKELFLLDQTRREAGLFLIVEDFNNVSDREFSAIVLAAVAMGTAHFISIEEMS